jgi:hypothetical protein
MRHIAFTSTQTKCGIKATHNNIASTPEQATCEKCRNLHFYMNNKTSKSAHNKNQ